MRHLRTDPRIAISSGVNWAGLAISICGDVYGSFLAKPWTCGALTYVGGVRGDAAAAVAAAHPR